MRYVDVQRRREERFRSLRGPASFRDDGERDPYFSFAVGLTLAYPAAAISFDIADWEPISFVPWIPVVAMFARGVRQLRRWRWRSAKSGGEKHLLMSLQEKGRSLTPVEAALRTSLTVDEAEEILSRLANRGHLLVESRDGALYYALPGRRSADLEGWIT